MPDEVCVTLPLEPMPKVPVLPEPGAFGAIRKRYVHNGVDLYCDEGTPVHAVTDGVIVGIRFYTGFWDGSPWWNSTKVIYIASPNNEFVWCYGEIDPYSEHIGDHVEAGELIGYVVPVLKQPGPHGHTSMLHLVLKRNMKVNTTWSPGQSQPKGLLNPTSYLLDVIK